MLEVVFLIFCVPIVGAFVFISVVEYLDYREYGKQNALLLNDLVSRKREIREGK